MYLSFIHFYIVHFILQLVSYLFVLQLLIVLNLSVNRKTEIWKAVTTVFRLTLKLLIYIPVLYFTCIYTSVPYCVHTIRHDLHLGMDKDSHLTFTKVQNLKSTEIYAVKIKCYRTNINK